MSKAVNSGQWLVAQALLPVRPAEVLGTGRSACATAQLPSLVKEGCPKGGVVGRRG